MENMDSDLEEIFDRMIDDVSKQAKKQVRRLIFFVVLGCLGLLALGIFIGKFLL